MCINSMQLLFVFYYVSLDVFASGVWATFAGLRDPSLRELASRLASTVIASRATGTTKMRIGGLSEMERFCCFFG